MSVIVWELIPNQYDFEVYLCLSDENATETYGVLNSKYELGFIPGEDFDNTLDHVDSSCIANFELRKAVILLNKFDNTVEDQSHLVHELFHLVTIIAHNIHTEINQTTTECWAYLIDFYYKLCMLSLTEHLKDKSK
jgi:hypothetical protein